MINPLLAEMLAKEKVQRFEHEIVARHQLKQVKSHHTSPWVRLMCILKQLASRTTLFGRKRPDLQVMQKGSSFTAFSQKVIKEGC